MNHPLLQAVCIVGCIKLESDDAFDILTGLPHCLIFTCSPADLGHRTQDWETFFTQDRETFFTMFGCIAYTSTFKEIAEHRGTNGRLVNTWRGKIYDEHMEDNT